ncbi:hypothetical protein Tco_0670645 [Tanacetum coccineum]
MLSWLLVESLERSWLLEGRPGTRTLCPVLMRSPIYTTWEDPKDDTICRDIECDIPSVCSPVQTTPSLARTPASLEWSLERSSDSSVTPSPVPTLVPAAALNEGDLLEVGAQLELHGSILHTHTEHLDSLPLSRFECHDQDFVELFARRQSIADQRELQDLRDRVMVLEQSLSSSQISSNEMMRFSSDKHFFMFEMWNVLWIPLSSCGSSSLYATGPTLAKILNGPIYHGLSLPRFPKRIMPFHGKTFNITLSPTLNSKGYV